MKNTTVSVIIPSFNGWKTIGRVLQALKNQSRASAITEVLVVDSSTDERTRSEIQHFDWEKIKLVEAGERLMPAVGRNKGARLAKGRLLVFVDSDACLGREWLETVMKAYREGRRLGSGAVALPRFQRWRKIAIAQYFLQMNEYMDTGRDRIKSFFPSCSMFCDKELFWTVGGFPEIRASEDTLFFLEASKREPAWFLPKAKAFHIFRENCRAFLENQRLLGHYIFEYRRQYFRDKFYYKGLWPFIFLPAFAAIKLARMTGRALTSRWGLAWRYVYVLPWVIAGMGAWSWGFAQAAAAAFGKKEKESHEYTWGTV